jgi:serine phosphatase RsbU (regulator of sigma subunit)/Tfp pilus assembly protein PilF
MTKAIFIFLLFIATLCKAGNPDSLKALLKEKIHDTTRANILNRLVVEYEFSGKPEEASKYFNEMFVLSSKIKYDKGLAQSYNYKGRQFFYDQIFDSAIKYFDKSAWYAEKAGFSRGIVSARNNIAAIYAEKGDIQRSLIEHRKLASYNKKVGDKNMEANSYSNIGFCFMEMSKFDSAIHYLVTASKISEALNDLPSLGNNYYNLASINFNIQEYEKSLSYIGQIYKRNLPLKPNLQNVLHCLTANNYNSLGQRDSAFHYIEKAIIGCKTSGDRLSLISAYLNKSDILKPENAKQAEENILQAIKLSEEIESESMLAKAYGYYGSLLNYDKRYPEAIKYFNLSQEIQIKNNNSSAIVTNLKGLAEASSRMGNFKDASLFLDSLVRYKDRLKEADITETLKEIEAKYETEKKDLEIQNANAKLSLQEEKNKQKEKVILIGSIALIFTAFFGVIAFLGFRRAKTANKIIHSQNQSLAQKNVEVEEQKLKVEEKQKEIIDSINYAKKIQAAVLAGEDSWRKVSKEYFVLFKPKDIVSGDFYWAYNTPNNRSVFALADCTGHGVPGGFMSMLGNSFLNEIVIENKIFNAAAILNKLRDKIINALEQNAYSEQKDGMDIALCVWNKLNNTLEFAGANNSLMILRDNKIVEIKGDKMPIGIHHGEEKPFSSTSVQLQPGDCLYLTTDGFPDQFGGPKGKKFKYKQTEELLIQIHQLPFEEQEKIIEKRFNEWKGKLEQIDDVTLIGVKV